MDCGARPNPQRDALKKRGGGKGKKHSETGEGGKVGQRVFDQNPGDRRGGRGKFGESRLGEHK